MYRETPEINPLADDWQAPSCANRKCSGLFHTRKSTLRRFQSSFKLVIRIGGDEFAVVNVADPMLWRASGRTQ